MSDCMIMITVATCFPSCFNLPWLWLPDEYLPDSHGDWLRILIPAQYKVCQTCSADILPHCRQARPVRKICASKGMPPQLPDDQMLYRCKQTVFSWLYNLFFVLRTNNRYRPTECWHCQLLVHWCIGIFTGTEANPAALTAKRSIIETVIVHILAVIFIFIVIFIVILVIYLNRIINILSFPSNSVSN
jgi:hypothetical protein